jgi:hypothetical protein
MKHSVCIALIAATIPAQDAAAADKEGNYAVWGSGGLSCHSFNKAMEDATGDEYRHYAMGYLTAYHTFVPDTYRLGPELDFKGVLALVADYCTRVPMDSFERALKLTAEELAPKRQRRPPVNRGELR